MSTIRRRSAGAASFEKLSVTLAGVCTLIVGIPVVGFVVAPLFRKSSTKWVPVGKVEDFAIGKTTNVTIVDPSSLPWAGHQRKKRGLAAPRNRD